MEDDIVLLSTTLTPTTLSFPHSVNGAVWFLKRTKINLKLLILTIFLSSLIYISFKAKSHNALIAYFP